MLISFAAISHQPKVDQFDLKIDSRVLKVK